MVLVVYGERFQKGLKKVLGKGMKGILMQVCPNSSFSLGGFKA